MLPIGGLVAVVLLGAGGLVVAGKLLGGAVLAVPAATLVIAAGVWLARLPVSDRFVRAVQEEALRAGGIHPPEALVRERTRRDRRMLGYAAVAAGGVGLAFAFAAL